MRRALFVAVVGAVSLTFIGHAQNGEIRAGRNTNMNPGIANELIGDAFLQRQVETKHAVSVINSRMVVALANDYRTVDFAADPGFGEGLFALVPNLWGLRRFLAAGPPDAWLGLYRSIDGGVSFVNGLVPGFPTDTSQLGLSQPWAGLAAASDAAIASDAYGHFHGAGLFFDRGGRGMIGYFRLTNFNDESRLPIRFDAGFSKAIETTSATATGRFADLPSMIWDAHEPKTGSKGQGGGCGHIYLGYTLFTGAPANNSAIKFSKSTDCGLTFTVPKSIQGKFKLNQRVLLFVDPRSGPPKTTGGGTVYAVWTSFEPRQIVLAKSVDFGDTWSEPVAVTALSGPATSMCTYDQPTNGVIEVPNNPADESARSLAFATGQVGLDGAVTLAWPERVQPDGLPLPAGACTTDGATAAPPKIVVTRSVNAGLTWSDRRAIDRGVRCETNTPHPLGPFEVPPVAGRCPSGTTQRPAGAQLQPVLSQTAGKTVLLYLEGRADPWRAPEAILGSTGYHSGRNAQMDVRAAELSASGQLLKTIQVSQYTLDVNAGDIRQVTNAKNPAKPNAKAYSRAYMLQYKGGTISFMGDHNDLAAFEPYVFDSPPRFATGADVPAVKFLGSWGGDNREALFPARAPTPAPAGDLFDNAAAMLYDPPGGGTVSSCNAGARNSNAYAAYIGPRIDAFVNQSFKQLGGIQRSYAVTIRNRSSSPLVIRMAMQEKEGFNGSFDQQPQDVNVIGNDDDNPFCSTPVATYPTCTARRTIQPQSSMTFTAFVSGPADPVAAPVKIHVDDVSNGLCNLSTFSGCDAIIRLNPAPTNPAPLAGTNITDSEHHGPSVSVSDPEVKNHPNPNASPTQGNPTQGNPTQGNPTQGNPTQGNAGFSEYTDYTFTVKATNANTISQYSSFANFADPDLVDGSHLIQLIITRLQKVPTIDMTDPNCPAIETPEDEVLSIVDVPKAKDLGTPTQGNPTQGNPTQGNPTQGNPTQGNNTYALAPDDAPGSAAARARYRATAIASAVQQALTSVTENIAPDGTVTSQLGPDEVRVTYRFFHCDNPARGTCNIPGRSFQFETEQTETVPRTEGAAANALIQFVTVAGAGDNDNGVISPPKVVSTIEPDVVISFPQSVTVSPTTGVIDEAIDVSGFTITNQGQGATSGSVRIGMYLSTDSVITPADTLAETFTTAGPLLPGGQQFFPFEGDTNSVDIPKVAPGTYFVGYLADDVGQVFETNEANNYVSAASAQLTVVADLVITTTSPLPGGAVGATYTSTQLTATGGVGAYHWVTAQSGPLPAGLELSDGGLITGTPKVNGTFPVEVHVSDSAANPHHAVKFLQITITGGVPFIGLSAGNQQSPAVAAQRPGAVAPSASSRRRASWTSGSAPATSAERMRRNSE